MDTGTQSLYVIVRKLPQMDLSPMFVLMDSKIVFLIILQY